MPPLVTTAVARLWAVFAAGGLTIAALLLVMPNGFAATSTWLLIGVATIGALLFGAKLWRPAQSRPLQLLAGGQTAFCAATAIFAFYDLVLKRAAPYPSVADAVYLLGNVLLAAALFRLGRERSRDSGPLLEAGFFAAAFAIAAWFTLIAPNLFGSDAPAVNRIAAAVYPVTDILIVGAAALLLVTPGRRPLSFALIALGASVLAVADVAYAWELLHGPGSSRVPTDAGWLLAYVCFGAAALHPSIGLLPRDETTPAPTLPVWRIGLIGATCLFTPLLLISTHDDSDVNLGAIGAAAVMLCALALVRVGRLVRDAERATTALAAAEAKHRALIEQVPAAIYTHGVGMQALGFFVNAHTEAMLGFSRAEWAATPNLWSTLLHPEDRERMLAAHRVNNANGVESRLDEYRLRARDGRYVWLRDDAVLMRDESGEPAYWQGIAVDVTAERVAQEAIRERERQFRILFAANPHPMWVYDQETLQFLEVNDAALERYGYQRDEFLAMTILAIRPQTDVATFLEYLDNLREPLELSTGWRHLTKTGQVLDVDITSHTLTFAERDAVLVVAQDVTARKALERQLAHQALHDALTGLPNRALLSDRLQHAVAAAGRRAGLVAVLFLDLDRFKVVNDGLGHDSGDRLLIEVAARLRGCLRAEDTLARFGGDEFVVLLEEVADAEGAEVIARRIVAALNEPILLHSDEIVVGVSVGVALGSAGSNPADLLREADVAMYHAKRRQLGHALFHPALGAIARERLGLEAELRRAIGDGGLMLHFQPIVDLDTHVVLSLEALVRWRHPARGVIYPSEFIPIAEESGLIAPLGRWVLLEACRQLAAWRADGIAGPELRLNVNLSASQIATNGVIADVAAALAASGLEPAALELEITETVAMAEDERTIATLRQLRGLGVRLAVDDFGAGASPLGYLRRCQVDALKIDRSFIAGLAAPSGDGERMVRAMLAFARTLELDVTAEGIETPAQAARLLDIGCERGQGYLFARPQPPDAIEPLLRGAGVGASALLPR